MSHENIPCEPAPPPYTPPDSDTFSKVTHYKWRDSVVCRTCGQFHEPNGTHLYDYHAAVDEDLVCHICLQPLVNPIDTKCGHTFCSHCLQNYLQLQKQCPVDRQSLTILDCQQSSLLVNRLLDKLLVVCPNVDYCEEVLPRSELDTHLAHRCRGAITKCIKVNLGCSFQGPRSALQSHLWECDYRDQQSGQTPVQDGEVSTLELQRKKPELGIAIVGGCDTPLACILIQEVVPEGDVARDGRLCAGDQILEVNGEDLTQASHYHAQKALAAYAPVSRLTVYREKAEDDRPIEKEEILKITLSKSESKQLGIKLVGKRLGPGVYILDLVLNSLAALDGRLRADDRVLEINGVDVLYGTQEQAARLIQTSPEKVQFVISRKSGAPIPDIIHSTSDAIASLNKGHYDLQWGGMCRQCQERIISINKGSDESLGISVAGGIGSPRGDIPIYVTNVNVQGCLGRCGQIKKGDVVLEVNGVSLLGLTHTQAVALIKANADTRAVNLKIIEAPETAVGPGNFVPTWLFWQQLPRVCQRLKTVTLLRSPSGSLGFSVVGGSDCVQGSLPIYIKSVVIDTPAAKDGRLKCGDMLLSVNNVDLQHVSHTKAVDLLKQVTGPVSLTVVSWPGTVL